MQFAPEQASMQAITRWALRFGSVVTSEPRTANDGPETWCRHADFGYYGVAVTAYAHIPAEPADDLTHSAGPGGRPSPGPASQNHPLPRESKGEPWHVQRYQRHARTP